MIFGMPVDCSGCGSATTCLFAAQYLNEPDHKPAYICKDCYEEGKRCWVLPSGELTVSKVQPDSGKPAVAFWDEGWYVTGGVELTYPETSQP